MSRRCVPVVPSGTRSWSCTIRSMQGHETQDNSANTPSHPAGDTAIVTSLPRVNLWRRLLLGLFFLSGISGLLYEVAWTRMLHLLFGDTVLAVSTVLASFMAGLALGSFWSGRYVDRRPRVLALYAGLEAGNGASPLNMDALLAPETPPPVSHPPLEAAATLSH